jgi:hypothetical protein
MKKYLVILLLFLSCKKDTPLISGTWVESVKVESGTMVTTLVLDNGNYTGESYILSDDRKHILQSCPIYGTYTSGLDFKAKGQNFYWGKNGKVDGNSFKLKIEPDDRTGIFVKL